MKPINAKEGLLIFLRGLFMGIADVIPGVSGGTVALITGIYERLIFAIKGLNIRFLLHLLKGDLPKAKKSFLDMDIGSAPTRQNIGTMGERGRFNVMSRVLGEEGNNLALDAPAFRESRIEADLPAYLQKSAELQGTREERISGRAREMEQFINQQRKRYRDARHARHMQTADLIGQVGVAIA